MLNTDTSTLHAAAQAAAGAQQYPASALYVVATPIGNVADLSLRALHVLGLVDAVACEDTRVSGALLHRLGLSKPLLPLHQHNEREAAGAVLVRLARGERVAYVSDAGSPAISDPGAMLVAAVAAAGHRVLPIPGASSPVAALSVAGDAIGRGHVFHGFLPSKGREREQRLAALAAAPETQVLMEAPHRIAGLVDSLAKAAPQRRLTLARELTKQFEEVATLAAADAPAWLAADAHRSSGEYVLVLHALAPATVDEGDALGHEARQTLAVLLRELPLKQAVALAAEISGAPRNALYQQALAQREG